MTCTTLIIFDPWFTYVKNGKKKLESRRGTLEQFKNIKKLQFQKGQKDKTLIVTRSQSFIKDIKCMRHYKDLASLLENEPLFDLLPGIPDCKTALEIYHSFWSDELIEKSGGMIVFELE